MRSTRRLLLVVTLVGTFVLLWSVPSDQDVATAQTRKPIMMTRIYTGADGLSHSEEVEMTLTGNGISEMKATSVQFSRRPPGPASDWHVGPRRQFVITLSGRAELEVAGGKKVPIGPGHINLIEDTTGKGHITHNLGPDDRIVVTIPLEDQTVSARR
jgi:quercetin dioxygenase-like cupin family protein